MIWLWNKIRQSVPVFISTCLVISSISYVITLNIVGTSKLNRVTTFTNFATKEKSGLQEDKVKLQPVQATTFKVNSEIARTTTSYFLGGGRVGKRSQGLSTLLPTRRDTASLAIAQDAEGRITGMSVATPLSALQRLSANIDYKSTALSKLILLPEFTTSNPLELYIIFGAAAQSPALDELASKLQTHAAKDPNYFTDQNSEEIALLAKLAKDTIATLKTSDGQTSANNADFTYQPQSLLRTKMLISNVAYRNKLSEGKSVADPTCFKGLTSITLNAAGGICINASGETSLNFQIQAQNDSYLWTAIANSNTLLPPKTFHLPLVTDIATHAAVGFFHLLEAGIAAGMGRTDIAKGKLSDAVNEVRRLAPITSSDIVSITLPLTKPNALITAIRPAFLQSQGISTNSLAGIQQGELLLFTGYTQVIQPLVELIFSSPMPLCTNAVASFPLSEVSQLSVQIENKWNGAQSPIAKAEVMSNSVIDFLSLPGVVPQILQCALNNTLKESSQAIANKVDSEASNLFVKKLSKLAIGYLTPGSGVNGVITLANVLESVGYVLKDYQSYENVSQWQVDALKNLSPTIVSSSSPTASDVKILPSEGPTGLSASDEAKISALLATGYSLLRNHQYKKFCDSEFFGASRPPASCEQFLATFPVSYQVLTLDLSKMSLGPLDNWLIPSDVTIFDGVSQSDAKFSWEVTFIGDGWGFLYPYKQDLILTQNQNVTAMSQIVNWMKRFDRLMKQHLYGVVCAALLDPRALQLAYAYGASCRDLATQSVYQSGKLTIDESKITIDGDTAAISTSAWLFDGIPATDTNNFEDNLIIYNGKWVETL